jgi:hypothetical protein
MVGASFSEAELEDMRNIPGGETVPWLYSDPLKSVGSVLTGPLLLQNIASRVKACLEANGVVEGAKVKGKGEILRF